MMKRAACLFGNTSNEVDRRKNLQELSHALGGHPLAIAHFAGYVSQSQCTIEQILDSYQKRRNSSRIWSCADLTSVSSYDRTLDTVWDLAFQRLSPDAREILDIIAFLEADRIPEEMFIEHRGAKQEGGWKLWDIHRYFVILKNFSMQVS